MQILFQLKTRVFRKYIIVIFIKPLLLFYPLNLNEAFDTSLPLPTFGCHWVHKRSTFNFKGYSHSSPSVELLSTNLHFGNMIWTLTSKPCAAPYNSVDVLVRFSTKNWCVGVHLSAVCYRYFVIFVRSYMCLFCLRSSVLCCCSIYFSGFSIIC